MWMPEITIFGKHNTYKVFSNIPFMYTSDLMNILLDVNTGAEVGYVGKRESALMYGGTELGVNQHSSHF